MPLSAGTRIGPYEVVATLGAGGMGEVYRARDPRLGRDVALKVLPDSFAGDPERMARFQREAQVLASLKHPNIGSIYGLEEGVGDGGVRVQALVLELVEGETLANRIAQGPIDWREALPLARQVAEALEAAHEQGVIHRDLKPANIRITPDGVVKVLDFGLARLTGTEGSGNLGQAQTMTGRSIGPKADASDSPTQNPTMMTGLGTILGTAAYMAPEQTKGRPADRRSDVWAFGCVLYEMLTGVNPFRGEDVADTLAFILTREPNWTLLPGTLPLSIRRLLQRALDKDRRRRLADAGDARLEIDDALAAGSASLPAAPAASWSRVTVAGLAVALILATAAVTWTMLRTAPSPPDRVTRLTITPPAGASLVTGGDGESVAITRDGSRVAYRTTGGQLLVRALDDIDGMALTGLGAPVQPFFSPDGTWIGYFDGLALKKVAVTGGAPVILSRLDGPNGRGGSWGSDGTIVFGTGQAATGLMRIGADGGDVTVLTKPDRARGESDHAWPSHLPDERGVLFTILPVSGDIASAEVAVLGADSSSPRVLFAGGSHARYVPTGHLVYLAGTEMRAVRFDLDRLETVGEPVTFDANVRTTLAGAADFDVAADGTLVYVSGGSQVAAAPRTLVWVDRQGREEPLPMPARQYTGLRMAPDGTRVALEIRDQEDDIWIWDFARETLTRLTTAGPSLEWWPVWTPNSLRVIYSSNQAGASNLYAQTADGSGGPERITDSERDQLPTSVAPGGSLLMFDENAETFDVMSVELMGAKSTAPVVRTRFDERNAAISPDGRWLAIQSNESGQTEVYVRPFPNVDGGRWQVSTGGGSLPIWSHDGRELFYMTSVAQNRALMGVRTEPGTTWTAGRPFRILEGPYAMGPSATYDVSPDGRRFLLIRQEAGAAPAGPPPTLVVVQNGFEELRRRPR